MTTPDKPQKVWELTTARQAAAKPAAEPYRVPVTPAAISCAGCLVWVTLALGLTAFVIWQSWLWR